MAKKEDAIDKEHMIDSILSLHTQVKEGLNLAKDIRIKGKFEHVIVAGMGGSALPGLVLQNVVAPTTLKVTVVRDYELPTWADKNTLVFAVSYSGNTEEAVSAYRDALKKGCAVVALSSGGKLKELARRQKIAWIEIPKPSPGFQPRAAIGYLFFCILGVLINGSFLPKMDNEIETTIRALQNTKLEEKAKDLADNLTNRIPVIYTSEKLSSAGYKWKIAFNENAKTNAYANVFSELNHNEMNGYPNAQGKLHVIFITNDDDHPRIRKRMSITKELIKKQGFPVTEIALKGRSLMTKLFSAILIGDLTAYHVALNYKTDPTPVKLIEAFKKMLG